MQAKTKSLIIFVVAFIVTIAVASPLATSLWKTIYLAIFATCVGVSNLALVDYLKIKKESDES